MLFRKTDGEGLFIEDVINPEIEEGEEHLYIAKPVPQGFYHPKWNGAEWEEGMSQEKIDELKAQNIPELSEQDLLMLAIADLDTQREKDKTDNQIAMAELAETILGGLF